MLTMWLPAGLHPLRWAAQAQGRSLRSRLGRSPNRGELQRIAWAMLSP
jgi:hypothetical protein